MKISNQKTFVLMLFLIIFASSIFIAGCSNKEPKSKSDVEIQKGSESTTKKDSSVKQVVYTCPMHSEVQQNYPGKCPKCKMDLEPKKDNKNVIEGEIYTCEMHPEIEQNYSGKCPKCKMDMILKTHK